VPLLLGVVTPFRLLHAEGPLQRNSAPDCQEAHGTRGPGLCTWARNRRFGKVTVASRGMLRPERGGGLQSPIRASTAAPARPEARPVGPAVDPEVLKPLPRLGRVAKGRLSPTGQRIAAAPLPAPSALSSLYSRARALTVAGAHSKSDNAATRGVDEPVRRPRQICGVALNEQPAPPHCPIATAFQISSCPPKLAASCHVRLSHSLSLLSRPSRH
jgi:hypothetical protein